MSRFLATDDIFVNLLGDLMGDSQCVTHILRLHAFRVLRQTVQRKQARNRELRFINFSKNQQIGNKSARKVDRSGEALSYTSPYWPFFT